MRISDWSSDVCSSDLGRRLSTKRILEIVTEHGVETPDRGLVKLPAGRLAASTLNRHMRQRGYDTERMTREPAAVRYQAERAKDRKSVVSGKSVSVRVDLGGRRILKKKKKKQIQ